ncbi:protein kinase domain-containing protein [Nocardia grenadensis]|uniref:protein kinase domain-containing protein n=1 Tax=Nocardia grenadensis TaxID=931537 RepID=UPI0007A51E00|nr:protein kinase [Nocardia grenadensis]
MSGEDLLRTQRETISFRAELAAAGYLDAVEIGRGGFGVVYRCRQPGLDRTVAVKVLTAGLDEDNRARFLREQRAMGRSTGHPNIVTVLEAGTLADGCPYLVMPYHSSGSLDMWIHRHDPLSPENVLRIGSKIAGALETAHQLGIVHRDVKPGNILLTDFGEPALTDFGIAHIGGGFETAAGTVTGSPAFTAPEVLEGEPSTPAADVYGLGATLFCALTGHAAFERRRDENLVAQFLRITTHSLPDLRRTGVDDEVSALVEAAMNRDPRERPSAAALGEDIRRVQRRYGSPTGESALPTRSGPELPLPGSAAPNGRQGETVGEKTGGNLPLELTGLVDRRAELAELKSHLARSRSVTLVGTGGVGKTRVALKAASQVQRDFADGVWLVDLAAVTEAGLLVDTVAATIGVRDDSTRPLLETLLNYLYSRETLLVLDNCEHLVEAVAELTETLLVSCPGVRTIVTSREPLKIAGEVTQAVMPLQIPEPDHQPSLKGLPRYDALTLFAERAAAVVPGFEINQDNMAAVTSICVRLDGVPLAIELAAARMRTLSPEQILDRLTDRYELLTGGAFRTAPARQRSLELCLDWSYDLCSPAEQRAWAHLSVFAGSCGLDAVEQVCSVDSAPAEILDVLAGLVDKSILIREQSGSVVRFRMLEILRDYGRSKLRESGEYEELRRRHRAWYERLALDAEAGWIGLAQPGWIARLDREHPNLREALESALSEDTEEAASAGLQTASALWEFWVFRGFYGEGRSWIERVLAHPGARSIPDRVKALRVAIDLAAAQGDFRSAATLLQEGRVLAEREPTPMLQAQMNHAAAGLALLSGDPVRAAPLLDAAIDVYRANITGHLHIHALTMLGLTYEMRGETEKAIEHQQRLIDITEGCGEMLYRALALRSLGVAEWCRGNVDRGQELMEEALRVDRPLNSHLVLTFCLEALSWIACQRHEAERAAVLMGAARHLWPAGSRGRVFDTLSHFHEECAQSARKTLGDNKFDAAFERGRRMSAATARAYALREQATGTTAGPDRTARLTKRERQVAALVARGLSNRQIATELVVSPRTAQGHVENILTKLGFTSRAQIAAWIVDESNQG